ncbi:MAG: prolipoprotein diacylglyceryl transferase [Bacilli bacterium]|nr:prolipoprotein diacylglyceryl transferase [Bacilli bacterium]
MNPIIFSIGSIDIRWYSVLILVGALIGVGILLKEAKRFDISSDFIINLSFYTLVFGIIGARLYYVLFNFEMYKDDLLSILKIWNGGLAIHGGLIAGFITIVLYCKRYNVRFLKIMDMAAPGIIIAQAIGRWGNFFNSEAHGAVTTLATLKNMFIPDFVIGGMNIGGFYYHPTFYYEFLWCVAGFILLVILRRRKYLKVGQLTSTYFMWYSAGRFFIESLRTDSLMLGGFKVAQLVSVLLFLIALGAMMIISRKGKFEDLYNEEL